MGGKKDKASPKKNLRKRVKNPTVRKNLEAQNHGETVKLSIC